MRNVGYWSKSEGEGECFWLNIINEMMIWGFI